MKSMLVSIALFIAVGTVPSLSAKTTLEFWQFWTDSDIRPVLDSLVTVFEAEQNGEIEVNITDLTWADGQSKIAIAFASGRGPDVVELGSDWLAQFADTDQLLPISELVGADTSGWRGWSLARYQDELYAWPWILGSRVMFVNVNLLQQAYPDAEAPNPATFAGFQEITRKIHTLGDEIYGWGSNTAEKHRLYKKFLPFLWGNAGRILSEPSPYAPRRYSVVSSEMAIEALDFYRQLHDSVGYVDTQRGIEDAFMAGQVGIVLSGDWMIKRINLNPPPFLVGTMFVPGGRVPGISFLGGELLAINRKSRYTDEALEFVRFLNRPDVQVAFCKAAFISVPSSLAAVTDSFFVSQPMMRTMNGQMQRVTHPPVTPDWPKIEAAIERAVEEALFGSRFIAGELRQAQRTIDSLIADD